MAMYRARNCPKCEFYVGYHISKPVSGVPQSAITSFCLNCNYHFPVHAVIRGGKDFPPRLTTPAAPPDSPGNKALAPRATYSRELRAIGQELEKRRFTTFNLKCSGDSYFVWSDETITPTAAPDAEPAAGGSRPASCADRHDPATKMLLDRIVGFLFSAEDIKRLEYEGVQNRRRESGANTGRRLSHLLRTIGEQVYRRHQRLLAVSWQDQQISVVCENAAGRRELNVLRTDNLYDLWVRMYLQRSQ